MEKKSRLSKINQERREDFTTDTAGTQRIVRDHYEQLYARNQPIFQRSRETESHEMFIRSLTYSVESLRVLGAPLPQRAPQTPKLWGGHGELLPPPCLVH